MADPAFFLIADPDPDPNADPDSNPNPFYISRVLMTKNWTNLKLEIF
jgi:hypothetical protein